MAAGFSTFLTQLGESLSTQNGPTLAYLLRPTSPHGKNLVKEFRSPTFESLRMYQGMLISPWDEIAIRYVLICTHVAKRRPVEAFIEHNKLVSLFFRYFVNETGWTLPALFSILRDLRDLALDADEFCQKNDKPVENMEEAARAITKAFSSCMMDRTSPPNESRKWGVYYVVSLVLKCYFRVRRISLSKNVLRALDADASIPDLSLYPRSHQVTFRYYIGMLSFLNEDYTKSEKELTLAFYHCNTAAHGNQQRILTYLLPLRILRGHLPTTELLDRFPVLQDLFIPFIRCLRAGDLRAYDAALESAEKRLVDLNLYFVLEKAREMCLRELFRRVWLTSNKSLRIPLAMFHAALSLAGMPGVVNPGDPGEAEDGTISGEEAECLVANMIYKGYMRGYISHEKQMVVLGKNAFPRLVDRPNPYSFFV